MNFKEDYIEFKRNISVGEQGKLIQDADFDKYVEKFGIDRALGYLEAIRDFNAYAEVILGGGYCCSGFAETGHMVRKHLCEFVDHNSNFLNKIVNKEDFDLKL